MNITFSTNVPVSRTMQFEKLYHYNLAFDYRSKCRTLRDMTLKVWLFVDGELAGECYGVAIDRFREEIEGCQRYKGRSAFYVYSTSILKKFQGRGLGRVLKAFFHGLIFGNGYNVIVGHATTSVILSLCQSMEAEVVESFQDWYGTGQTAFLYEIKKP